MGLRLVDDSLFTIEADQADRAPTLVRIPGIWRKPQYGARSRTMPYPVGEDLDVVVQTAEHLGGAVVPGGDDAAQGMR